MDTLDFVFLISAVAVIAGLGALWSRLSGSQIVYDHQRGLLYRNGRLLRVLGAGRHRFIKTHSRIDVVDIRSTLLAVPGQSILTKDNINVKLSLSGRYEVSDAETAVRSVAHYLSHLYDIAQIALRNAVAALTLEELLEKKGGLDAELLSAVAPKAEAIGIKVTEIAVRDIMLPSNLKQALAGVLEAQKEAQRQLEVARGEQAVLRSLANAAKLYESNPALLQARLIQSLKEGGNTIVFGGDGPVVRPGGKRDA